jgi:chromosome segregation ATPase
MSGKASEDVKATDDKQVVDPKTTPEGDGNNSTDAGKGSEDLQAQIDKLMDRNQHLEKEAKAAYKQRDDAKAKLQKSEDEELIKQNKFEDLYNKTLEKLETANSQVAELTGFKEQIEKQNQDLEASLDLKIKELPEAHQQFAAGLDLTKKQEFLNTLNFNNDKKPPIDTRKGGGEEVPFLNRKIESRADLKKAMDELKAQMDLESKGQG